MKSRTTRLFLKTLIWIVGSIVVLAVLFIGPSTYDYAWRCTKCLRESDIVEHQFFGLTYWKSSKLKFDGYDLVPILGTSCEHVFRKGGFGMSHMGVIGCGITGEGGLFRPRWDSLSSALKLHGELHDEKLLRETFKVVDELLPSDAIVEFYRGDTAYFSLPKLAMLSSALDEAKDLPQWKAALEKAKAKGEYEMMMTR